MQYKIGNKVTVNQNIDESINDFAEYWQDGGGDGYPDFEVDLMRDMCGKVYEVIDTNHGHDNSVLLNSDESHHWFFDTDVSPYNLINKKFYANNRFK